MIEKICTIITNKIKREMPEIDEDRAEIINYGLMNIIGEIPKIFIVIIIAYLIGILREALITLFSVILYKGASGGIHFKTHIGCLIMTIIFYCGIPFIAKMINLESMFRVIICFDVWIYGIIMIKKYAPADTENIPIFSKKERKKKKKLSYIIFSINLLISLIMNNEITSNIIIISNLVQTMMITESMYKITNNKRGYAVCLEDSNLS